MTQSQGQTPATHGLPQDRVEDCVEDRGQVRSSAGSEARSHVPILDGSTERTPERTPDRTTDRTPDRTWTSAFGRACGVLLQAIVNGLALTRISPNVLTFVGLVINIVAAIFFGFANSHNYVRFFLYAGLVIIGAGIFDMVDGRVARQTDQVTVFGAFFDSVIDRYSDVVLFFGLLVFYARGNRFFYVVLTAFVMITSLMVSYTRARSEALIGSCKVGFMERPERIVLIILGALCERWGVMAPALWVLAVLSTITVIHRISYTYSMAKGLRLDVTVRGDAAKAAQPQPIRTTSEAPSQTPELLSASATPRA